MSRVSIEYDERYREEFVKIIQTCIEFRETFHRFTWERESTKLGVKLRSINR